MGRSVADINQLWTTRRMNMAKVINVGKLITGIYNGDHNLTLPELERGERPAVANLVATGIDQHATRIASTVPSIICPPLKPTKDGQKHADERRLALQAWWYENRIPLMLRRRARHLIGLATSPVMLRPDSRRQIPIWEERDPLSTFPAPMRTGDMVPTDCIFSYRQTRAWLRTNYGLDVGTGRDKGDDVLIDILSYVDADEYVMVAVGNSDRNDSPVPTNAEVVIQELSRTPNRIGTVPVVIPGRITLDRLQGQFDQIVGMYESQATLWAYHLHAVKRGIFKETWLEGRPNENPEVTTVADPYQGDVGVVAGGKLQQFGPDPGVQTIQALNMLERNQRITGAVPAEFGGESPTNVRTDRRGQSVVGGAVDFPVQEHQELLAASLEAENRIAIAIAKAYWPRVTKTFVVPFGRGSVTYTPETTFDTDMQRVTYAYAGADTNSMVIEAGQRVGMGTLSKKSFMMIDPMVTDADTEHDRVVQEAIEAAFLQSIQAQASQPDGPWDPHSLSLLSKYVYEKNLPLYEAVEKVHQDIQAEQEAQAAAEAPTQQPGLGMAGAPGTPGAAIPPPGEGQVNLMQMLNSLRKPQAGRFGVPAGAGGR